MHYLSAFTYRPIQKWQGELGVLVLWNIAILETPLTPDINTKLKEALDTYDKLRKIWTRIDKLCPNDECRICNYEGDDGKVDENEKDEGDKEEDEENREDQEDQEDGGDEGDRTSTKAQKTTH
ncbi:MAG: hypothetical protein M1840_000790 [Geoglossum simile]|nr:MAG: hypothetical protein M1840_000790 [Geoglossum simile]